jgi:hypothetical protein
MRGRLVAARSFAMVTVLALMSIYKAPVIRLADICGPYFALSYEEAAKRAARHALPVPAFRLNSSRKAPLMVTAEALGAWIDVQAAKAVEQWARCQV